MNSAGNRLDDPIRYAYVLTGIAGCGLAVLLGAFGAHALSGVIDQWYDTETSVTKLENWETAIRYQFWHSLGLIVIALLCRGQYVSPVMSRWSAGGFLAGMVLFCGGLYMWVLTDRGPFVAAVPVGGGLLILGWLTLAAGTVARIRNGP